MTKPKSAPRAFTEIPHKMNYLGGQERLDKLPAPRVKTQLLSLCFVCVLASVRSVWMVNSSMVIDFCVPNLRVYKEGFLMA